MQLHAKSTESGSKQNVEDASKTASGRKSQTVPQSASSGATAESSVAAASAAVEHASAAV